MSAMSAPSAHPDDVAQTLVIAYKNWKCREAEVTDPSTSSLLYTILFRNRKPNVSFLRGASETPVSTSSFHTLSSKIDIEINGASILLHPRRKLSSTYVFESPALGGATLTWTSKGHWKNFDYVCLDEQQLPVARYVAQYYQGGNAAKLEFLGRIAGNRSAMDEIMATGMTLVYYAQVTNGAALNASTAASSASAASAAAAC